MFYKIVQHAQDKCTKFEKAFCADDELQWCLHDFADHQPRSVLWGEQARWKKLYICCAVRFLGNPDSVLDCEGCHAKWQWMMNTKRGIKFKMINSLLKLSSEIITTGGLP